MQKERYTITAGDCLKALRGIYDNSVDSIVTDPPYGLSFMGKKWDYDVPGVDVWRECLRVLKPGGHLLSFAGTRTQHRMACAIEDAGFEIRDMIAWVYASGFPKSHNLNGEYKGWGTALKPALEPISVCRKPLTGTVAANVLEHGTGAINVDGCRVEGPKTPAPVGQYGGSRIGPEGHSGYRDGRADHLGRWPANLIHDGSDEVVGLFPESKTGAIKPYTSKSPRGYDGGWGEFRDFTQEASTGSAARFFYCAKASKKDRGERNRHPTVKPTDLMRYLCRLVTPPGGLVLDPFMGSGSTGKAAMLEGFRFVGIEREPEYIDIAKARIESARGLL